MVQKSNVTIFYFVLHKSFQFQRFWILHVQMAWNTDTESDNLVCVLLSTNNPAQEPGYL